MKLANILAKVSHPSHFTPTMRLLTVPDGSEYLFSYETPVAGFVPGEGYFRTSEQHSRTTTAHIGRYLSRTASHPAYTACEVSEKEQRDICESVGAFLATAGQPWGRGCKACGKQHANIDAPRSGERQRQRHYGRSPGLAW